MNISNDTNFHEALSLYRIDSFERENIPDIRFLRKIFSELNFSSYLKVCQVSKGWHKQATKLNQNEWENPVLLKLQMKRYLNIRNENREKNLNLIEYFIFRDVFTSYEIPKSDDTKIQAYSSLYSNKKQFQIKVILLSENYNEEEVQISGTFKKAISNLEINGKPHPYYCCIDFSMDTNGFYENRHVNWVKGIWGVGSLDESTLCTGESIVIYNSSHPSHFAVYLADGIYLSLHGKERGLQAANLEEMMRVYHGDMAYKLTLIKAPYENEDKPFSDKVFNALSTLCKVVAYKGFVIGSFNP